MYLFSGRTRLDTTAGPALLMNVLLLNSNNETGIVLADNPVPDTISEPVLLI